MQGRGYRQSESSRSPSHDDLRTTPLAPQILSCSPERPPLKLVHVVHTQDGSLKCGIHGDRGCVASTSTYSDQATGGGAYYYHCEEGGHFTLLGHVDYPLDDHRIPVQPPDLVRAHPRQSTQDRLLVLSLCESSQQLLSQLTGRRLEQPGRMVDLNMFGCVGRREFVAGLRLGRGDLGRLGQ